MVGKSRTRKYASPSPQNFPINEATIESLRTAANFLSLFASTLEVGGNLNGGLSNITSTVTGVGNVVPITHRRKMSAATRKKIATASKNRWAKQRAAPTAKAAA